MTGTRYYEYKVFVKASKFDEAQRLMAILKSTTADGFDDLDLPTVIEAHFVNSYEEYQMEDMND